MSVPILINCRDRLGCLVDLVGWLERTGNAEEIYLLDNDSTYEPLLEWYERTPHTVVRLGENYGRLAPWVAPGVFDRVRGRRFVFTDPDVVPTEECPRDAIDHFSELLDRHPFALKVGFALRIDDLPAWYPHRADVVAWERQCWRKRLERGVYVAPIDTTFALYREDAEQHGDALRTGAPYVARHTSWYLDFDDLPPDEAFYQARAENQTAHSPHTSHWIRDQLPPGLRGAIDDLRRRSPRKLYAEARSAAKWFLRERPELRRQSLNAAKRPST